MTYKKEQLKYLTQKQMDKTKMRVIFVFIVVIGCFHNEIWAQTGINTESPDALLHVEATNKVNPTGADGVLIPRVSDFPGNGVEKGQLIYILGHPTANEGFWFWDGDKWVWLINNYERTIDKATYVATGSGNIGSGSSRVVRFDNIEGFDTTGFSVNNNIITVGKTGKFLLTFTASVKRTGTGTSQQTNFTYQLFRNGIPLPLSTGRVTASTSNEIPTATSAALSTILDLNEGDTLQVQVFKSDGTPENFAGYGSNGLTLTFLRN